MSVSKQRLDEFAKFVINHEALPEIRERMKRRLFDEFITATDDKRKVIGDILNADALFFSEIQRVLNEIQLNETLDDSEEE